VTKHAPAVLQLGSDLSLTVDRAALARVVVCHTGCLLSYHNEEYTWGITTCHRRSAIPRRFRPYIFTPLSGTAATFACDPNLIRRPTSTGPRRDEMLRGRSPSKHGHSVIGQDPLDTKQSHPRSAQSHLALLHFRGRTTLSAVHV